MSLNNKVKLNFSKKYNSRFPLIFLILILLEITACYFAYYTVGGVKQFVLFFLFVLNIIPFILYHFKVKIGSWMAMIIIAIMIIPNQVILILKWTDLKKESIAIQKYIYQYKKKNERFPENILAYEFKNKKLIKHFSYQNTNSENFGLRYYVGTQGTTYYYFHKNSKWEYYPD